MIKRLIPTFKVTNERTTEAATKGVLFHRKMTEFKFHKKTPVLE